MKIVLLSGGSGRRLWPLSNDVRSKQFLRILKNEDNQYESMVQRVYRQIKKIEPEHEIVLATSATQLDSIKSQLGDYVEIVIEPERRDTFPAIALACAYLKYVKNVDDDEPVLVLPVDSYAEDNFFHNITKMECALKKGLSDLILLGIKPTYPSAKYGYIMPGEKINDVFKVDSFKEKPTEEEAEGLIRMGALWNGGVFAFRLNFIMELVRKYIPQKDYNSVFDNYEKFKKISFDYEVVEKASSVGMVYYDGEWKDLGTWNTLSEQMEDDIGRVIKGENTTDTQIINELGTPIVALGVKNLVIVAAPDGILVTEKESSSSLKKYVEQFTDKPYYEEKEWGESKILEINSFQEQEKNLIRHLIVHTGEQFHYCNVEFRFTNITVLCGKGIMKYAGKELPVQKGDMHQIKLNECCMIEAKQEVHMMIIDFR